MTLPNLITIARLLLVPLIVWFIVADQPLAAFGVLVAAGISDAIDGFIARQFDLRSELGTYLDPIADKTLLVSIYVTLAVVEAIPVWLTILIVSRDILIVGAVVLSWVLGEPSSVQPHRISKVNTVLQIVLAAVVLGDLAFSIDLATVTTILIYVVAILTVGSAAIYLVEWVRHMGAGEAASSGPAASTVQQRARDDAERDQAS